MGVVQARCRSPEMVPGTGQIFRRGKTESGEPWARGRTPPGPATPQPGPAFPALVRLPWLCASVNILRCSSLGTCLSHPVPLMSAGLLSPTTSHLLKMFLSHSHKDCWWSLPQDEFWAPTPPPVLLALWAWPGLILLPSPSLQSALWRSSMGRASHFSCLCRGCFKMQIAAIPRLCWGRGHF